MGGVGKYYYVIYVEICFKFSFQYDFFVYLVTYFNYTKIILCTFIVIISFKTTYLIHMTISRRRIFVTHNNVASEWAEDLDCIQELYGSSSVSYNISSYYPKLQSKLRFESNSSYIPSVQLKIYLNHCCNSRFRRELMCHVNTIASK
jgi:hypothetical protein